MDYLDFEIEVAEGTGGAYAVRVLRSPAGEATGEMRLPFDSLALQNRLQALQIALLRSGTTRRRVETEESRSVQAFGQELWESLFSGAVLARLEASRGEARRRDAGIRIKLRVEPPQLAALPWEYLFDAARGDYMSLSAGTPLVRYIPLSQVMDPLEVKPPLRILGVAISPTDLPALDLDRERQRLDVALAGLRERGLVELVWATGGTWRDLQQMLWKGPWHIFHFIGHGGFDERRGEGLVVFADENGKAQHLSGTNLGRLLGDHDPLRLVILNACESARGDTVDVFSSTAAAIVRRGTPAVVAMQYEITDVAAIEFSRSFYEAVASGIPVDESLAEARKGVALAIPDTLEWGTPVLFMRAPDGVLFKMTDLPVAAPAPSKPAEPPPAESIEPAEPVEVAAPEPPPMPARLVDAPPVEPAGPPPAAHVDPVPPAAAAEPVTAPEPAPHGPDVQPVAPSAQPAPLAEPAPAAALEAAPTRSVESPPAATTSGWTVPEQVEPPPAVHTPAGRRAKPSVVPLVVATTVGVIGFLILLLLAAMSDEFAQAGRSVPAALAAMAQTWR